MLRADNYEQVRHASDNARPDASTRRGARISRVVHHFTTPRHHATPLHEGSYDGGVYQYLR
jgi:hypothetical protein